MTSSINPNNIDGTFPIAGQDNDSQGFRTNFTNIKNNLSYAKSELEDLQAKGIFKSGLTGTTLDNNLAGTALRGAEIRDFRETRVDRSTTSGTVTINHVDAHYYTVTTSGNITLAFSGFPAAGKVGRVKVEITVSSVSHTVTLPSAVSLGTLGIAGINSSNVITFAKTGVYIFEFTTDDGGTSIHIEDLSRPRDYFHSSQIALQQRTPVNTGSAGDIAGMIAVNGSYVYVCTGTYDGSTVIWKRASLSSY